MNLDGIEVNSEIMFAIATPMGFRVQLTRDNWHQLCTLKHPAVSGKLSGIKETLDQPMEIRRSVGDSNILHFYSQDRKDRWLCVVVKRMNSEGILVSAYFTENIKEGEQAWKR